MLETVIAAAVTGLLALVGVIISNNASNIKMQAGLEKAQAVTDTKIEQLASEVRTNNARVQEVPKLSLKVEELEKKVDRLEKYHNQPYT